MLSDTSLATPAALQPVAMESKVAMRRIALALFFGFLCVGLPFPVIPLYVKHVLLFSDVTVGTLVGLQFIATVAFRPFAGRFADKHGGKRSMIQGAVISALSGVIYVVANWLPGQPDATLCVLAVGRVVAGFGESRLVTGAAAWIVATLGPNRAGKAMSVTGMAMYAAVAAGAPVGLGLYQWGGLGVASVAVVVAPAIAVAIAFGVPVARSPVGSHVRLSAILGRIWLGGISLALQGVGFAVLSAFSTLYFNSRGWSNPALAMSLFGGGYALIRLTLGHLPDRLGGFTVAGASLTVEFVGQVLLWLAPNEFTALLGAALSGAGCSLVFPSLGVEALRIIPPQARATTMGTFVAFQDIAYGISAPLVGTLIGMHGYQSVFMVGAAAGFIGILTVILAKHRSASFSSASRVREAAHPG